MLVRFQTESGFSDYLESVAVTLLKMMGASGKIPGAIEKDRLATYVNNLRSELKRQSEIEDSADPDSDDISAATRAVPLLELLDAAVANDEYLMWDYR